VAYHRNVVQLVVQLIEKAELVRIFIFRGICRGRSPPRHGHFWCFDHRPRHFRLGLEAVPGGGDYGALAAGSDNANYGYLSGLHGGVWALI